MVLAGRRPCWSSRRSPRASAGSWSRTGCRCGSAEGEMVGIVGPNGAGKTSLFSLISGDLEPDSGQIRLGGAVVTRQSPAARCRLGIGRTYQVPRPFGAMTVFENVLVAVQQGGGLRRRASYARAAAAHLTRSRTPSWPRTAAAPGAADAEKQAPACRVTTAPPSLPGRSPSQGHRDQAEQAGLARHRWAREADPALSASATRQARPESATCRSSWRSRRAASSRPHHACVPSGIRAPRRRLDR